MLSRVSRARFPGLPELMGEFAFTVGHSLLMMLYTQVSRSVPLRRDTIYRRGSPENQRVQFPVGVPAGSAVPIGEYAVPQVFIP